MKLLSVQDINPYVTDNGILVMKTAWSSDFLKAPKNRQILVRHEDWVCPTVIQWNEELEDWLPCEDLISNVMDDSFSAIIDDGGVEWAEIPE